MINNNLNVCPIWGEDYRATILQDHNKWIKIVVKNSDRAGGAYEISEITSEAQLSDDQLSDLDIQLQRLSAQICKLKDPEKARLTTMLVDQRIQGVECPRVTINLVNEAKNKPSLPVHKRAERLLRYFANKSNRVGDDLDIGDNSDPMCQGAMAWSESTDWQEVLFLAEYLKKRGWIGGALGDTLRSVGYLQVTVEGYGHIADLASNQDSAQCFVAMWFSEEMNDLYEQGIEPAIKTAGYTPMRIDKKPHANKIDDEIIAEIRRSRFLVADFTHGGDGARGGVYYEAGFAHGLNLPVIFTCRNDMVDKLHFDTRQYNHIIGEPEKFDEFRKNLTNRIEALIGEGPNKGATKTPG